MRFWISRKNNGFIFPQPIISFASTNKNAWKKHCVTLNHKLHKNLCDLQLSLVQFSSISNFSLIIEWLRIIKTTTQRGKVTLSNSSTEHLNRELRQLRNLQRYTSREKIEMKISNEINQMLMFFGRKINPNDWIDWQSAEFSLNPNKPSLKGSNIYAREEYYSSLDKD